MMKLVSRISRNLLVVAAALLATGGSVLAQSPAVYSIDTAHSSVQFSIRHLMISNVRGEFDKVTGTVAYDPKNLAASSIEAVIDVNSISTREPKRDAHLKSPDFFDAAKFPTMIFKSKQFTRKGDNVMVKGDLTMHGVTREVILSVDGPTPELKDPLGNVRFGASATTTINRKDWGISYNKTMETGGLILGEDVAITIDIEAVKKK